MILPGETINYPFVFKSPTPGVYQEQWELKTQPTLCGGASLIVTLRGVAIKIDKFKPQRDELEVSGCLVFCGCRVGSVGL